MAENDPHKERVTISDALTYIQKRTGFAFERKTFTRYVEAGAVTINGESHTIIADQIELRWFILRTSLERIVEALLPVASKE